MLDTFYLAGLLDEKCEKAITMINSKETHCRFFVRICFVNKCSCWPNNFFFSFCSFATTGKSPLYPARLLCLTFSYISLWHSCDNISSDKISNSKLISSLYNTATVKCVQLARLKKGVFLKNSHSEFLDNFRTQSNFFAALCNIFVIFRQFCDIIAAL